MVMATSVYRMRSCRRWGVDVGDSLYLIDELVGTTRALVLFKTPRIPNRIDELVEHWDREQAGKLGSRGDSDE